MTAEIFGYLAAFCSACVCIPQAIQLIRTKNVQGLSKISYILYWLGGVLWLIYGIFLNSYPMLISNGLSLFFSSIILCYIIKYQHKN